MQSFANARILCVDDDNDSCELIKYLLSFADPRYEVMLASSAQEALSLIGRNDFDLYVLDYALPEISGVELCREIRRTDSLTPIIFFSAMAREQDKITARIAGATEYLVKPDGLDILTETVAWLLGRGSPHHFKNDARLQGARR